MADHFGRIEMPRYQKTGDVPERFAKVGKLVRAAAKGVPEGCTLTIPGAVLAEKCDVERNTISSMRTLATRMKKVGQWPKDATIVAVDDRDGPSLTVRKDRKGR